MMAEPAAALGHPAAAARRGAGRLGRPGDPRPRRRRLHRPRHAAAPGRGLPGRHLRPRARADRPPARARGRRRRRAARARGARPRPGQGGDARGARPDRRAAARGTRSSPTVRRGRRLRLPVRPQDHPRRVRRQGRLVRRHARRSARRRSRPRRATGVRILAEERVDFRRELSALVARSPSGQAAAYPVVESTQRDGICREVVAPAPGLAPTLRRRGPGARAADRRASST